MKIIAFYALAAALYVTGGTFMKYSQGLTRLSPTLALVTVFSAGALIQAWAMKHEALGPSYVVVLGLEALLADFAHLQEIDAPELEPIPGFRVATAEVAGDE